MQHHLSWQLAVRTTPRCQNYSHRCAAGPLSSMWVVECISKQWSAASCPLVVVLVGQIRRPLVDDSGHARALLTHHHRPTISISSNSILHVALWIQISFAVVLYLDWWSNMGMCALPTHYVHLFKLNSLWFLLKSPCAMLHLIYPLKPLTSLWACLMLTITAISSDNEHWYVIHSFPIQSQVKPNSTE